jgi:hypothetical protein
LFGVVSAHFRTFSAGKNQKEFWRMGAIVPSIPLNPPLPLERIHIPIYRVM